MAATKAQGTQAKNQTAETKDEDAKTAPEAKETTSTKDTVNGYNLVHKGHGRYAVEGHDKVFASRKQAIAYIADLQAAEEYDEKFGDKIPEGIEIHSRPLEYRGTLLELPMNELYTPDGDINPYYDREWAWGWGRAAGDDIAKKQARSYRVVTREQLEASVDEGRVPDHYRSLLLAVDHGNRMQYGDLVLMRQPRVLWRQHRAEKEKAALARVHRTDEQQNKALDDAGVKNVSGPIKNELSTGLSNGLKTSGF